MWYIITVSHQEIRKRFLDFFEKNGHCVAPSSSLVPKDDSSVLLTTAGMQQFKPYYLATESPYGNRVASIQKCFRTSSIDEVGDEQHLTFFEMLGNFSFKYPGGEGSYFKEEAIKLAHKFITEEEEMNLKIDYVSVFGGDEKNNIPCDNESVEIWKKLGMPQEKIKFFGKEDNFWGPTGNEGPCGPTTEIYVNGIEIWNIVFNKYYFDGKKYEKLKYQGIDTGMGLERLAMAVQNTPTIFETDLFQYIISELPIELPERTKRIIVDHTRAIIFLISDGLRPSNKEAEYVLRRLMRRIITFAYEENIKQPPENLLKLTTDFYKKISDYRNLDFNIIKEVYDEEYARFLPILERGRKEFEKKAAEVKTQNIYTIPRAFAFNLFQSAGITIDILNDFAKKEGVEIDKKAFTEDLERHKEISRAGTENKFGGHGVKLENDDFAKADNNEKITKLHTATHLLHAALRKILGKEIRQMGSDITEERLRFDFSFGRKLTEEEISAVQNLVNEKINEGLLVFMEEMSYNEAIERGALAFFKEKYPEKVTVYSVDGFSKEICGGPHAKNTGELGKFKIIKEESSSAGVRRIKAILED